jgi:hypothetical protein
MSDPFPDATQDHHPRIMGGAYIMQPKRHARTNQKGGVGKTATGPDGSLY